MAIHPHPRAVVDALRRLRDNPDHHASKSEAWRLGFLNVIENRVHHTINRRAELAARVARCTLPGNWMWVAESGQDCDGVRYQDRPYLIVASVKEYVAEIDRIGASADGWFNLFILTPEEAADCEPWHVDTYAEMDGY